MRFVGFKLSQPHRAFRYFLALSLFMATIFYIAGVAYALPLPEQHHVTGHDISFPQCGRAYPQPLAFGVVGVNGGVATKTNPCLADQLRWSASTSGVGVGQLRSQLYVNTGNPYSQEAVGWPSDNRDPLGNQAPNPHGLCDGQLTLACAWQYGWNRSVEAVHLRFKPAAQQARLTDNPRSYMWWLDIETMNSWQYGSEAALATNRAVLEAMADFYDRHDIRYGVYSTSYQLGKITGTISPASKLSGVDSWLAGGEDKDYAPTKCSDPPLTPGGRVVMVQYIQDNFDFNYSCL